MSSSSNATAHATPSLEPVYEHRRHILDTLRAFRASQVLMACAELGVFELLANEPLTDIAIANATGADMRGTSLLLNAAVALGLLTKREGCFANAPMIASCLAQHDANYIGDVLKLEGAFYRRWDTWSPQ